MTRLENMTEEELRRLALINLCDLSYATGLLDGLKQPNNYLSEQWSELYSIVIDDETEKE